MKRLLLTILICYCSLGRAQFHYPDHDFISPLDIPIQLAGNFGELRENHFHTGIDITTHGQEGLPVKAAADGYISRIKVGPWGYGKVIYITHANGYVTVYGHLKEFNDAVATYVGKEQYKNEMFEVELFLQPNELIVKQGEVVAYSGNTGSSGGPHLHFEIRDAKTEDALNPLLFGLPVQDHVAPTPMKVVITPAEPNASINGKRSAQKFTLIKSGTKYILKDSIVIYGKVGFMIDGYDKEDLPNGKNGIYGVELTKDKKTIYKHHLERMPFEKSRYINCFVDYKEYEVTNHFYMRSFLLPNNQLPIYDTVINDGYVNFHSDSLHKFTYTVSDVFGNKSNAEFKIRSLKKEPSGAANVIPSTKPFETVLLWGAPNSVEESAFRLETEAGAFYQNEELNWTITSRKDGSVSSIAFDRSIPIQKACTLTFFMALKPGLWDKTILVEKDKAGKLSSLGGTWSVVGITAEIKEFSTFLVMMDTTAPSIKPSNFDLKGIQSNLSSLKSINFTMGDNLSGVKSYRAMIDGKWVLLQYEPKKRMIWYTFDSHCGRGSHELILEVIDKCGNKTVYTKKFSR